MIYGGSLMELMERMERMAQKSRKGGSCSAGGAAERGTRLGSAAGVCGDTAAANRNRAPNGGKKLAEKTQRGESVAPSELFPLES